MKVHLHSNDQQGTHWRQRILARLRQALRPLQWLLAQVKARLEDINGARAGVVKRGSVVITLRGSDHVMGCAMDRRWFERQPQALALIPVRIAATQPMRQGRRRDRHK